MSAVPSLFVPKNIAKQATDLIHKKTGQTVRDGKSTCDFETIFRLNLIKVWNCF